MAADDSVTKGQLLAALRRSAAEALATLRALPARVFEEGRYENGWNGRQILAHLAAIEWTYPRLLELPAGGDAATQEGSPRGGMDGYNDRQVEKRAGATIAALLEGLRAEPGSDDCRG